MRTRSFVFAVSLLCVCLVTASLAQQEDKSKRPSPPGTAQVTLKGKTITIDYSRPFMRGRKIMGGLVPYGKVWRTGANAATSLTTDTALDIAGTHLPAGNYTLYTVPGEKSWQLIVNKQTGQSGLSYDKAQDLGRAPMNMSKPPAPVETYKITLSSAGGNRGNLQMEWADMVASAPFTVK